MRRFLPQFFRGTTRLSRTGSTLARPLKPDHRNPKLRYVASGALAAAGIIGGISGFTRWYRDSNGQHESTSEPSAGGHHARSYADKATTLKVSTHSDVFAPVIHGVCRASQRYVSYLVLMQ